LAWRNSGRKSPLASWTENSVRALWFSQANHHRYPCRPREGLYPSMFPRWLSTVKTLFRFGVALARLMAAGRRLRTSGRAAMTNGRIWFFTIGAPGIARFVTAWLAAGISRTAGIRLAAAGPS